MAELDDDKVMDVSKPGKSKPISTSRPVITTHATLPKEPVAEVASTETEQTVSMEAPSQAHKTISPISEDVKPDKPADTSDAQAEDSDQKSDDNTDSMGSESASVDALADSIAAKKQSEKDAEEIEKREAATQELITSKKYYVPLAHDSTKQKTSQTPLLAFVAVIALLIIGYVLVDLGTVDPGFDVPFHILGK